MCIRDSSPIGSLALSVGVLAVCFFKFCKVILGQRAIFLGDAGHVGAGIEYPDILRRIALLEEDDVCLDALAVWGECPARQAQDSMQVAILHENFEYLARLVFKQTVVRQNHRGSTAWLERVHYM